MPCPTSAIGIVMSKGMSAVACTATRAGYARCTVGPPIRTSTISTARKRRATLSITANLARRRLASSQAALPGQCYGTTTPLAATIPMGPFVRLTLFSDSVMQGSRTGGQPQH